MRRFNLVVSVLIFSAIGLAHAAPGDNGTEKGGEDVYSQSQTELTEGERDMVLLMREEEKFARDVYLTLFDTFGIQIFSNISDSEQRHMDLMKGLIENYNLVDPVVDDTVGAFTNTTFSDLYQSMTGADTDTLLKALNIGAYIEELDILDLEKAMEGTDKADILAVYENLKKGSENHLRAFIRQIEKQGVTYEPQLMGTSAVEDTGNSSSAITLQPGLAGTWYNPEQSGHGFFINVAKMEDKLTFVVSWYTFDQGKPVWLLGTAAYQPGDTVIQIPVAIVEGANFGAAFNSNDVTRTDWGTLTFHFSSCDKGMVEYTSVMSSFGSGSIELSRLTNTEGVICNR